MPSRREHSTWTGMDYKLNFVFLLGLASLSVEVFCQSESNAPYITIGGRVLPNNSYLNAYEIGSNASTGVQCHTNFSGGNHYGQWYSPYGLFSSQSSNIEYVYTADIDQGVVLVRGYSSPTEGIYRCTIRINSTSGRRRVYGTVFIGIYRYISTGSVTIQSMTASVQSSEPLRFSLICRTRGGPVTSVTWTRDSEEVEGGVSVIINSWYSYYTSYLNATEEGVYQCIVSNNKPSTDNATLNMTTPDPPSNFTVTQIAVLAVALSWTAPPQYTISYIIYYKLESANSPRRSVRVNARSTNYVLRDLVKGGTYSFSIVASLHQNSTESRPVNITLVTPRDLFSIESDHDAPFYAGTALNITCVENLPDSVHPDIIDRVWIAGNRITEYSLFHQFNPLDLYYTSGVYSCFVCLKEGSSRYYYDRQYCERSQKEIAIRVQKPPLPVNIHAAGIAEAGSALHIQCSVSLVPNFVLRPTVELYGPGEQLLVSRTTNHLLNHTVDPVGTWDIGLYVCKAEISRFSIQSESRIHSLSVQLPRPNVSISASPPEHVLSYGSTVSLTCEAELSPAVDRFASVSLVWGGPRIIFGERAYSVVESGFGLSYSSSLTMTRLSRRDQGDYTCTVRVAGEGMILGNVVTRFFPLTVTY